MLTEKRWIEITVTVTCALCKYDVLRTFLDSLTGILPELLVRFNNRKRINVEENVSFSQALIKTKNIHWPKYLSMKYCQRLNGTRDKEEPLGITGTGIRHLARCKHGHSRCDGDVFKLVWRRFILTIQRKTILRRESSSLLRLSSDFRTHCSSSCRADKRYSSLCFKIGEAIDESLVSYRPSTTRNGSCVWGIPYTGDGYHCLCFRKKDKLYLRVGTKLIYQTKSWLKVHRHKIL